MITSSQLHFNFDPPFPSFMETITALKQNPDDDYLFAVVSWVAREYGTCFRSTESLAQSARMTPATASNSRYRLIKSGFLNGEFVTRPGVEPAWRLTVPQTFNFSVPTNADLLSLRFAEIEQRLGSGEWVVDGDMTEDESIPHKSAIDVLDAILNKFKAPWKYNDRRILEEGLVPLGVRWNILFTEIVTQECYQWLESSGLRSLYSALRNTQFKDLGFIDFNLGNMPVGMLSSHTEIQICSRRQRGLTVNGKPICGFCGCEGKHRHSHLPFRIPNFAGRNDASRRDKARLN